eukprot:jgi/Mesen1/7312/ME000376S06477
MADHLVPKGVMTALSKAEIALKDLEGKLQPYFDMPRRDLESQLSPLEKAEMNMSLAHTVNTLFCCVKRLLEVNIQATSRFIENAIPDLTPEQRRLVRDLGKKRKSSKEKNAHDNRTSRAAAKSSSIADEATAFLLDATKDLLVAPSDGIVSANVMTSATTSGDWEHVHKKKTESKRRS